MAEKTQAEIIADAMRTDPLGVKISKSTDVYTFYNVVNLLTTERTIFYTLNEEQAKKIFLDSINADAKTKPTSFMLERVALWNKTTGIMVPIDKTKSMVMTGRFEKQIGDDLKTLINSLVEQKVEKMIAEKQKKGIK